MNTNARTPPSPEPLNEEERALAQRLARLGPRGQPSPAVDARILAAAQASLAGQRRTRSRWPMTLGVAASLTLAIGLAWQLRPLPGTLPVHDETTAAMQAAAPIEPRPTEATTSAKATAPAKTSAPVAASAADDSARIVAEPLIAPAAPPPEPLRQLAPAQPVPVQPAAKQYAPEQPAPAPVVFDDPSPIDIPPPPPSPPAPPPPAASQAAAPPSAFPSPPASSAATAAPAASASRTDAATQAARRQLDNTMERRDVETAPAAIARDRRNLQDSYADSAQGRRDWLRDIRTLRDAGRNDAARDLLRDFRARYPDYPLADDLQALLR